MKIKFEIEVELENPLKCGECLLIGNYFGMNHCLLEYWDEDNEDDEGPHIPFNGKRPQECINKYGVGE